MACPGGCGPYTVIMSRDANGNIIYTTVCARCGAPA